jgi:hypothetical protein
MTCKDAINSDTSSEDKELYFLSENGSYNKIFESDLQGTIDQNSKIKRDISTNLTKLTLKKNQ